MIFHALNEKIVVVIITGQNEVVGENSVILINENSLFVIKDLESLVIVQKPACFILLFCY